MPAEWLMPYLAELGKGALTMAGGHAMQKILGTPQQEAMERQLAAISRLQPEYLSLLQQQMRGRPTAVTEAIRQQVAQQSRAAQQALATSASRLGQAGTTTARGHQARLAAAESQQLMQELGRAQLAAQQQVGALTGEARRTQARLAAQEASDIAAISQMMLSRMFDLETRNLLNEILRRKVRQLYNPSYEKLGPGYTDLEQSVKSSYFPTVEQTRSDVANVKPRKTTGLSQVRIELPDLFEK